MQDRGERPVVALQLEGEHAGIERRDREVNARRTDKGREARGQRADHGRRPLLVRSDHIGGQVVDRHVERDPGRGQLREVADLTAEGLTRDRDVRVRRRQRGITDRGVLGHGRHRVGAPRNNGHLNDGGPAAVHRAKLKDRRVIDEARGVRELLNDGLIEDRGETGVAREPTKIYFVGHCGLL